VKSALFTGQVFHKRLRPTVHVLRYRVFSMLLALDEIDTLESKLWLFSRNRWNLFSFYDKDFGEGASIGDDASEGAEPETLDQYVNRSLNDAGITQEPNRILLSCYPRVCGYTFNPLSLFYCLDKSDAVFAVLHEVHNTFGERHVYALSVSDNARRAGEWINQSTDKALFVSPFAHMNMHYEFRLNVPDERQVIVIRVHDEKGHLLTASYTAKRQVLSARYLLKSFFTIPLVTFKVMIGIHWEAMRLWVKKVPWFSHQSKQSFSSNKLKNP